LAKEKGLRMKNRTLSSDYIRRCRARIGAVDYLYKAESWPDVVRESQEVVELALKALLRHFELEVPRVHDVSAVLEAEKAKFDKKLQASVPELIRISKTLRRDRELAFYGSEDLTPSDFYNKSDAKTAKDAAEFVVKTVSVWLK
jgi:HEPN domain-containing protein